MPGRSLRPKLEVVDVKEILSVVPVYPEGTVVTFKFLNGA